LNSPNQSAQHTIQNPPKKQKFYDAFPDSFQRKEAVDIGLSHGIKTRSVDYCLEKWEGKLIQKLDVGVYVKIKV
jgi:hypothetical protein